MGAALCLSHPVIPEYCSNSRMPAPVTDEPLNCIVGDIQYSNGDFVGVIGKTCVSSSNFSGTQSFCRDGEVQAPYNNSSIMSFVTFL